MEIFSLYLQAPLRHENIAREKSAMLYYIVSAFGDRFTVDLYCYHQPLLGDDLLNPKGPLFAQIPG